MRLQNTGRVTLAGGRLTPYRRSRQAFREVCLKIQSNPFLDIGVGSGKLESVLIRI